MRYSPLVLALSAACIAAPCHAQARRSASPPPAAHAPTRADSVSAAIAASDAYLGAGLPDLARASLAAPPLNPVRDLPLVLRVRRQGLRIDSVETALRLARAGELLGQGRGADALALYDSLLAGPPRVHAWAAKAGAESLRGRARAVKARAEDGVAALAPEAVRPWVKSMATLPEKALLLALYLATAAAVVLVLRWAYRSRKPRKGAYLFTVQELGGDGSALFEEVRCAVLDAAQGGLGSEHLRQEDMDGAALASPMLRPLSADDVPGLRALLADEAPIRFGPVSFTPKQLYGAFRGLLEAPPEFTVRGSLAGRDAEDRIIQMETHHADGRLHGSWHIREGGAGARGALVRRLAACHLYDRGLWNTVTRSREGFLCLLRGLDVLSREETVRETSERERLLSEAASCLRAAVALDDTNYMAWLKLAETLRKRGMNDAALRVLDRLQQRLCNGRTPPSERPDPKLGPCFLLVVRYHRALTLSKFRKPRALAIARQHFRSLLTRLTVEQRAAEAREADARRAMDASAAGAPQADLEAEVKRAAAGTREIVRLMQLVLCGLAAGEAAQAHAELRALKWHDPRRAAHLDAFWRDGVRYLGQLRAMESGTQVGDSRCFEPALSTAYQAVGHLAYLRGQFAVSVGMYDEALRRNPEMPGPYVGRAVSLFKLSERCNEWTEETRRALDTALRHSPGSSRAHYYRGRLAWAQCDPERAAAELALADPNPRTLAWRAVLLAARDRDYSGAARFLRLSLKQDRRRDERWPCVVRYAVQHLQAVRAREAPAADDVREAEDLLRSVIGWAKCAAGWQDPALAVIRDEARALVVEARTALHPPPAATVPLSPKVVRRLTGRGTPSSESREPTASKEAAAGKPAGKAAPPTAERRSRTRRKPPAGTGGPTPGTPPAAPPA
ncbi:MAG: hypothetical protein JWM27_817 [Gemmatimonadetes bacterium]|nr:hypothetical protein [Gemmatimonadota bacterium]